MTKQCPECGCYYIGDGGVCPECAVMIEGDNDHIPDTRKMMEDSKTQEADDAL